MMWRVSLTNLNAGFPASIGSLATLSKGVSIFDLRLDGQPLRLDGTNLRLKD